jgi:hypothetical protein
MFKNKLSEKLMNNTSAPEAVKTNSKASNAASNNAKAKQLQQLAQRLSKLPEDKKAAFREALESKGIDPWKLPIVHNEALGSKRVSSETLGSKGVGNEMPLSFAQQRLWFVEQMENDNALYNLVFGMRFKGELNFTAIEKSIYAIGKRHTILRTSYHSNTNGEAYQKVMPFDQFSLNIESLIDESNVKINKTEKTNLENKDIEKNDIEKKVNQRIHQYATEPFDLTSDYSFRFNLIKTSDVDTVGVFVVHHIAFDYLSIELITREFAALILILVKIITKPAQISIYCCHGYQFSMRIIPVGNGNGLNQLIISSKKTFGLRN